MSFFDSQNKLEDKYKDAFEVWTKNPTKSTTGKLLVAIQPDIDRGVSAHASSPNPLIASHARRLALQAVRSYDPAKAKLGTHIVNNLQGLKRISQKQTNVLSVP